MGTLSESCLRDDTHANTRANQCHAQPCILADDLAFHVPIAQDCEEEGE
jgi:hypothetical protein